MGSFAPKKGMESEENKIYILIRRGNKVGNEYFDAMAFSKLELVSEVVTGKRNSNQHNNVDEPTKKSNNWQFTRRDGVKITKNQAAENPNSA